MNRISPHTAGGSYVSSTGGSSATSEDSRLTTQFRQRLKTMINIPSTLKISLRALRVNKMRSALTMLGIIIGVGAVIAMLAVGTGASEKISEQISSIGSNLIIILPGSTTSGGLRMGMGSQPTLTTG